MKKHFINFSIILFLAFGFSNCKTPTPLVGIWTGKLAFSNYESISAHLNLKNDSTFIFIKQVNEEESGFAFFGNWKLYNKQIVLDGGSKFQLKLSIKTDKLEVLDFEGNEVIGDKRLMLLKANDSTSFDNKFIATGDFTYFADAALIQFCNTEKPFSVVSSGDYINAERYFITMRENDSVRSIPISGVFSFVMLPNMEGVVKEQVMIHSFDKSQALPCSK